MASPELDTEPTARAALESTFSSWDGVELFYRTWPPTVASNKAIVLLHRGHEHSGRFQELVDRLYLPDCWFFACDARGHGRSPGERGFAESFQSFVRDLNSFVAHVSRQREIPVENFAIVANSIGAIIASTWIHDYAPPIRALVLAAPAFRVKLYVPLAIPGLRLLHHVKPKAFIKSYVRPAMLTHDADEAAKMASDPLSSRNIAVNILLDMHDTATRVVADAAAIRTPLLLLAAGSDWVVQLGAQRRFFDAVGSTTKRMELYEGFHHALLHETDRARPIATIRTFLVDAFAAPPDAPSLLASDRHGHTARASNQLRQPLSPFSPRAWYFGGMKLVLKTIGRLSEGIRIGWRTGFNSGQSLDHVYRNQARGTTALGRLTDRIYLDSPGWTGIRQRKVHLEQMLERTIRKLLDDGQSVRLLDIAAGSGRYVLDVLDRLRDARVTAELRDRDQAALDAGRNAAEQRNIVGVTFRVGDAFDGAALAAIEPRPNLAIVSGLYELFSDNELVLASLRGIGQAVPEHGWLIYTNQPWHPQLELIARSLVGMDGQPWIMRCRTQQEMDQLVEAAGFEKVDMLIDAQGMFSVSLARRTARREMES